MQAAEADVLGLMEAAHKARGRPPSPTSAAPRPRWEGGSRIGGRSSRSRNVFGNVHRPLVGSPLSGSPFGGLKFKLLVVLCCRTLFAFLENVQTPPPSHMLNHPSTTRSLNGLGYSEW